MDAFKGARSVILDLGQNLMAAEWRIEETTKRNIDDTETEEDDGDEEHMGHRLLYQFT